MRSIITKTKIKQRSNTLVMRFFIVLFIIFSTIVQPVSVQLVQAAKHVTLAAGENTSAPAESTEVASRGMISTIPTPTLALEAPRVNLSITPEHWEDAITAVNQLLSSQTAASASMRPTAEFHLIKPTPINAGVLKAAKGANIDLVFQMGNYTWTINGKSITDNIDTLEEVNLTITEVTSEKSKSELKKAIIKALKSQKEVNRVTLLKKFNIEQEGKLPFTGTLTMHLSTKYKDRAVFLSRYDKEKKQVKPRCHSLVDIDGNAVFKVFQGETYFISLENPVLPSVATKRSMESKSSIFLVVKNLLHGAEVSFSSNKDGVVTVDEDGMITASKAGIAVITTKICQGGKTYTYKTKITVRE